MNESNDSATINPTALNNNNVTLTETATTGAAASTRVSLSNIAPNIQTTINNNISTTDSDTTSTTVVSTNINHGHNTTLSHISTGTTDSIMDNHLTPTTTVTTNTTTDANMTTPNNSFTNPPSSSSPSTTTTTWDFTKTPILVESTWPQSNLRDNETKFVSISVEHSNIRWALHGGQSRNDWTPYYHWTTPHVDSKLLKVSKNKVEHLCQYLWSIVKTFIFGGDETYNGALRETNARGHEISFYILNSTNDECCTNLVELLTCIPCRIIHLKPDDFYNEKEGRYPTMGVDRAANMLGAKCLFGSPNLIVDCGTTSLTYTATDCKGYIIGGGIAPGMMMRLESLREKNCKIPIVTKEEVDQRINAAERNKSPIPMFATNIKDAIISNLLGELSSSVRTIRERWIEEIGTPSENGTKPKTINDMSKTINMNTHMSNHIIDVQSQRAVILTGGSSSILSKVLDQNIIACSKSTTPPCPNVQIVNLIHFGVAYALLKNSKPHLTQYIGIRVAKSTDMKGETVLRGSVKWVNKDDTFLIQYDDNERQEIDIVPMDEMLFMKKVYDLVGEKSVIKNDKNASHSPSINQSNNTKASSPLKDSSGKKRGRPSISSDIPMSITLTEKQNSTSPTNPDGVAPQKKRGRPRKSPDKTAATAPTAVTTPTPTTAVTVTTPTTPAKVEASKPLGSNDPKRFINKRVAKYFDGVLFFGTVINYNGKYWHIWYDDDDNEDMNEKELNHFLELYSQNSSKDTKKKN